MNDRTMTAVEIALSRHNAIKLFWLISLWLIPSCVMAQQYEFSGLVTNLETGEAVPGANVIITGTSRGASTNHSGQFRLWLDSGSYKIKISCIGYFTDTVTANLNKSDVHARIQLRETPLEIEGLTVVAGVDNPALLVIKEAVQKKKEYLSRIQRYRFDAYTKTVLKIRSKKDIKDSITGKKETRIDTPIVGITETQTRGYWQAPNAYKEVITARKQTKNFAEAQNLFSVGDIVNLNDDVIHVDRYSIVGPTAPNSMNYYDYRLLTSTWLDTVRIYRIRITPKSKNVPLMDGIISIAEGSFAVVEVDVKINEAMDGTMQQVHCRQQFEIYEHEFWMPIRLDYRFILQIDLPLYPPIFVESSSILQNYEINTPIHEIVFDENRLTVDARADQITDWSKYQSFPLSNAEVRAYRKIDSVMSKPMTKIIAGAMQSPIWIQQVFDKSYLTEFSDLYRFNRVEGNFVGIGLSSKQEWPLTKIGVKFGYGFAERKWTYDISAKQLLWNKLFFLRGDIFNKVAFTEDPDIYSTNNITYGSLLYHTDYRDYYRTKGFAGVLGFNPAREWTLSAGYQDEHQRSLTNNSEFSIFARNKFFRFNHPIDEGTLRTVAASAEYDSRQFINAGWIKTQSISQNSWWVRIEAERSAPSFNGDFDFARYMITVQRHQLTVGSFYSDFYAKGGWATGKDIPVQKLFFLESSYNGQSEFGTLRTLSINERYGKRAVSVWVEHHFGNTLFKLLSIPYLKTSSLDLMALHGIGWTAGTDSSVSYSRTTEKKPLYEAGFGVGHMFFRLDMMWRITHRREHAFAIRWSSALF
ncbi:carboxypeptidase-like regulatory domain-containing protein [bacterium]|nr:carboxypeptidase-like regulatory domain-containing protein [bacterium]